MNRQAGDGKLLLLTVGSKVINQTVECEHESGVSTLFKYQFNPLSTIKLSAEPVIPKRKTAHC